MDLYVDFYFKRTRVQRQRRSGGLFEAAGGAFLPTVHRTAAVWSNCAKWIDGTNGTRNSIRRSEDLNNLTP